MIHTRACDSIRWWWQFSFSAGCHELVSSRHRDFSCRHDVCHVIVMLKFSLWNEVSCFFSPKLKSYGSVIRPVVVYGCVTWVLKESIIQKLSVFEKKISRKIFGPTNEANGIWRIKAYKESDELIKHRNIINYVKAQRLSWFGYINRMPETSVVKRIHK